MESAKRPRSRNNNDYPVKKKWKEELRVHPESFLELGCNILSSSSSSSSPEPENEKTFYNEHHLEIAAAYEVTLSPALEPLEDFVYKMPQPLLKYAGPNRFDCLPNEIIVKILGFLNRQQRVAFGLSCRRFNSLSKDRRFWQRVNLSHRKLEVDHIGYVILSGVSVLRLNSTIFPSPLLSLSLVSKLDEFSSSVRLLDLSYAYINCSDLCILFSQMRKLEKLSLESLEVNESVIEAVSANRQLTTLNLAMVTGMNEKCVKLIVTNLTKLKSLNLGWTHLSEAAVSIICSSVSPDLKNLDLSGCHLTLRNEWIVVLTQRCQKLTMLDLSDCLLLSVSTLREIIRNLPLLESLAFSRCSQILPKYLTELGKLPNLKTLSVFDLNRAEELREVELRLPGVAVNQSPFSVIARPTVGIRRTSIWEEPTS